LNLYRLQQEHYHKALDLLTLSCKKDFSQTSFNQFKSLFYNSLTNIETQTPLHALLISLSNSNAFDHLEGGFFSHQSFTESPSDLTKSLLINAHFIDLFTTASGIYFDAAFSAPTIKSLQWIINTLQSIDGYFFLEMESENNLSTYYFLSHQQIEEQLDNDAYIIFMSTYNLCANDFYNEQPIKLHKSFQQVADHTGYHLKHVPLVLETAHQQLITLRKQQVSPIINQAFNLKANAKIIYSLYSAAALFNRDDFAQAADKALTYITLRINNTSKMNSIDFTDYQWLIRTLIKRLAFQWSDDLYQWLLSLSKRFVQHDDLIDSLLSQRHSESIINDLNILYILSSQKIFSFTANSFYKNVIARLDNLDNFDDSGSNLLLTLSATNLDPKVIIIRGQNFQVIDWQQKIASGFKPFQFIFSIGNSSVGSDPKKFPIPSSIKAYKASLDDSLEQINSVEQLLSCCP